MDVHSCCKKLDSGVTALPAAAYAEIGDWTAAGELDLI